MDAKLLIEENNKKRKLLTKENEAYYDDLLVYIRLQLTLSEQQSEEVLMEMLDHLIEGQMKEKRLKIYLETTRLPLPMKLLSNYRKRK